MTGSIERAGRTPVHVNVVRHQCCSLGSPCACSIAWPPTLPAHGSDGFGLRTAARYVVRGRVLSSSSIE